MRKPSALVLSLSFVALAPTWLAPAASSDEVAVARARFRSQDVERTGGTVFFLETPAGVAAVGAAHNFDSAALASATSIRFERGHSKTAVSQATRFLAPPGLPFSAPGGTIRDDLALFVLDVPLRSARVLEAGVAPSKGDRVILLGIPSRVPRDEDDLHGHVEESSDERLEIELDVLADLRGWGGAPVLSQDGRVVGVVQAAQPSGTTLRIRASPIAAVLAAAERSLDGGQGRPFARVSTEARTAPSGARRAADTPQAPSPRPTTGAPAARAVRAEATRPDVVGSASDPDPPGPPSQPSAGRARRAPEEPLLGRQDVRRTGELWIEIEHPSQGAVFGDALGAFVAGRALAPLGEYRRLDVMLVLDTSDSTRAPSGADINGNGVIGSHRAGGVGAFLGLGSTDAGDSVLAAEIAAGRRLIDRLDPRSTRVGVATFAGEPPMQGIAIGRASAAAVTEVPLTADYREVQRGLDRILSRGPYGMTHIAAGVDQATIELRGLRGAYSEADADSEKVVLFLTDGQPTLPYGIEYAQANTQAVLRAAERARKAGVRVYSFGIGEEALAGPLAIVRLADITGGAFTPVRNPSDIGEIIAQVDFANLDGVTVRNLTNGTEASHSSTNSDGSWSALVSLVPGKNVIEATARSTDGQVATERIEVAYAPGSPDPVLRDGLVTARNRLLEQRLVDLQRARLDLEREQTDATRRQLALEIERERERAREKAERQRRSLDLEVDDLGGAEPPAETRPDSAPARRSPP
jgi:hypothetical protein